MKNKELNEYWKIKDMKELIEIEKETKENTTITKNYLENLKDFVRLMEEAQEFGFLSGKTEQKKEDLKNEIEFLKLIKYGTSYTWMNDKIDEKLKELNKKLEEMK